MIIGLLYYMYLFYKILIEFERVNIMFKRSIVLNEILLVLYVVSKENL